MGTTQKKGEKRSLESNGSEDHSAKRAKKSAADKKEMVADYETRLKEKHGDKFSRFQFKIWAESLASGQYLDLETPPGYAMFNRESDKKTSKESNVESVMNGMLCIMNTLCQAITPTSSPPASKRSGSTLSPMKKAELRRTYLKQLSELHQLYDSQIITEEEYEEQREELIASMRNLKKHM